MSWKRGVLLACNSLLASIDKQFPVTALHVQFSSSEPSLQLNGTIFQ